MGTRLVSTAQRDFRAGMMRSGAPFSTDPRSLFDLINGLYGDDASAFKRGGTVNKSNAAFGTGLRWLADVYFDAGQRTVFANASDFGVLGADDATPVNLGSDGLATPATYAVIAGMMFIGGGYIYAGSRKTASYSTGTVSATNGSKTVTGSGTTWSSNLDAGMLFQAGNERAYVIASVDSDTQITLRDAYEGTTGAGKSYAAHNIYKITSADPYESASQYAVVANRLARTDSSAPHKIHLSEANRPHDWTATIVGGSPSSVATTHELPEGVRVVGFGVVGQTLLIFTTGGLWSLTGLAFNIVDANGNPQHRLDLVSRELILFSANGVTTYRGWVVAPCIDGIYLVDGISEPVLISGAVDDLWREHVKLGRTTGNGAVYRGHYLLPIIPVGASQVTDLMVWRVDRPVDAETQTVFPLSHFTGKGGSVVSFAVRRLDSPAEPLLLGADVDSTARVVNCSRYFDPVTPGVDDLDADGSIFQWALVSRDFHTPGDTENFIKHLQVLYELAGDGATIGFDYGFGRQVEGGYTWDDFNWAHDVDNESLDLYWEDDESDEWFPLECVATESDGTSEFRCRVNVWARSIRFRARNIDGGILRLRQLETWIRPSQAVRR